MTYKRKYSLECFLTTSLGNSQNHNKISTKIPQNDITGQFQVDVLSFGDSFWPGGEGGEGRKYLRVNVQRTGGGLLLSVLSTIMHCDTCIWCFKSEMWYIF